MGVGAVFPCRTGGAAGVRGRLARYERGPWQGVTRWWAWGWNLPWRDGHDGAAGLAGTVTAAARPLASRPVPMHASTPAAQPDPARRRDSPAAAAASRAIVREQRRRPSQRPSAGATGRGEQPGRAGCQQPGLTGQQRDRADASGSGPGQQQRHDHHGGGEPSGQHRPHPRLGRELISRAGDVQVVGVSERLASTRCRPGSGWSTGTQATRAPGRRSAGSRRSLAAPHPHWAGRQPAR